MERMIYHPNGIALVVSDKTATILLDNGFLTYPIKSGSIRWVKPEEEASILKRYVIEAVKDIPIVPPIQIEKAAPMLNIEPRKGKRGKK